MVFDKGIFGAPGKRYRQLRRAFPFFAKVLFSGRVDKPR